MVQTEMLSRISEHIIQAPAESVHRRGSSVEEHNIVDESDSILSDSSQTVVEELGDESSQLIQHTATVSGRHDHLEQDISTTTIQEIGITHNSQTLVKSIAGGNA